MYKITLKIFLLSLIALQNINSQTIDGLLLELNFTGNSFPRYLSSGNNKLFFSADDGVHGRELWVYDKFQNSTYLVKDIVEGVQSGIINSNFVVHNDQLFFTAFNTSSGIELWTSNGTEQGTFLLKDINVGTSNSSVRNMFIYNNMLFFSADDGINGSELWISDGTNQGTSLLKDINPGSNSSFPGNFFIFNGYLFFTAYTPNQGLEIWKSDGTTEGTNLFIDINIGFSSGLLQESTFLIFNNNFYFFADNGTTGFELWKSDGSESGTNLLKDIYPGVIGSSNTLIGAATNDYFVFKARTPSTFDELWISDGTTSGTQLLKDINPTAFGSLNENSEFVTFDNKIYFTASDNNVTGRELWVTDGTFNGTNLLKDIFPGSGSSAISQLTSTNGYLIFSARDNLSQFNTVWISDGTEDGTEKLMDINLSQNSNSELKFVEFDNKIFFAGGLNSLNGNELWNTDGTPQNTNIVKDIFKKNGSISGIREFTILNDKVIFTGTNGLSGAEPFVTDGTIEGTKLLKDIIPGSTSSISNNDFRRAFYTKAGNNVFFRANGGNGVGFEIFKTDGSEEGTILLKDIAQGNASSISEYPLFFSHNDLFYFKANDLIHGTELWRSDGTLEGTFMLKDILPGSGSGILSSNSFMDHPQIQNRINFAILNNFLHFIAQDNEGFGIWKTDGTSSGTTKVLTLPSSGSLNTLPEILGSTNNKIFYITNINNSTYGNNTLWSTDGTASGTIQLGSYFTSIVQQFKKSHVFNNEFYTTVYLGGSGVTLIKTDGTVEGTIAVTTQNFSQYNYFNFLKSCGNFLYFYLNNSGTHFGKELWRTDGTSNNTTLIDSTQIDEVDYFNNCSCIENSLFYTKGFIYPKQIWYINDSLINPVSINVNVTNSKNFQESNEGIISLFNFNGNLLFDGATNDSGAEIYFSNLPEFLNIQSQIKFHTDYDVIIFPNPSNGIFEIRMNDNTEIQNINVYDINGKIVLKNIKSETNNKINLSHLIRGIYILKIETEYNTRFKKIILK